MPPPNGVGSRAAAGRSPSAADASPIWAGGLRRRAGIISTDSFWIVSLFRPEAFCTYHGGRGPAGRFRGVDRAESADPERWQHVRDAPRSPPSATICQDPKRCILYESMETVLRSGTQARWGPVLNLRRRPVCPRPIQKRPSGAAAFIFPWKRPMRRMSP
jgi:hypothetical protein